MAARVSAASRSRSLFDRYGDDGRLNGVVANALDTVDYPAPIAPVTAIRAGGIPGFEPAINGFHTGRVIQKWCLISSTSRKTEPLVEVARSGVLLEHLESYRLSEGSCTVTRRPPSFRGVRVRVPLCAWVMLLTIARPRPTPAWLVRRRSLPR
jgi:hypothetical protein